MWTIIDFLADPTGMILRVSWRGEDPDNATASTLVWTEQLSPNMGTRASLDQAPLFFLGVLDCLADVLVRVFGELFPNLVDDR